MASAGPCASLHLAPDRQPRQHPTTLFFTGRMPFLPPNQRRQSTEGTYIKLNKINKFSTGNPVLRCTVVDGGCGGGVGVGGTRDPGHVGVVGDDVTLPEVRLGGGVDD